ncbi:MAG: hypothetical protein LBC51_03745 [Treponema sp.]|jgi:hypothetical protein|nr:hypothetical protein [Treponema sp.]
MSGVNRDPVYLVCAVRDMILDLTATVFNCIDFGYERAIKERQEKLKLTKKEFAEDCGKVINGNAPAGTSFESLKAGYDQKKQEASDFVTDTNLLRDKLNLSALYIDMGIHALVNTFMAIYGVTAADTPSLQLKGSGDIILKADKTKNLYVTKHEVGGSPIGAVHEVADTATFAVKAVKAVADVTLSATKLGYKSKKLADDTREAQNKKTDADKFKDEAQTYKENMKKIENLSK